MPGPESNELDQGYIQIPNTDVNLSQEDLQKLSLQDSLQLSRTMVSMFSFVYVL